MFVIGSAGDSLVDLVRGAEPSYTITLDAANAPAGLSSSAFESGVGSARYVDFDYASAKRATGYHVSLDAGGLIANNANTRISSMKSLTATFTGGQATLKYDWRALPTINTQVLTSGTPVEFTSNPYFFSITNTGAGELSLISLEIIYGCTSAEAGGETQFGTYPQSKVTDSALISSLNDAAVALPSSGNPESWVDYGYYISGSISSYMWYKDIVDGDDQYRGVYFTSYRPFNTNYASTTGYSYQDDNGYITSMAYWFKYEPITWRVLDVENEEAFLMADLILDSRDYYSSESDRTIDELTVYANNYEYSHIRSWLNDSFYSTAFTNEEKARIQTTMVDNSVASTGYPANPNISNDTDDKVFLLSYSEANDVAYGFANNVTRQIQPSAYSQAQGAYASDGNGMWLTRSPQDSSTFRVRNADRNGDFILLHSVQISCTGVIPAMWISL